MPGEDVTGRDNYKESFATAAAAALHGGVLHVADMPNNPAAPSMTPVMPPRKLAAAESLPVTFTLYAGIGPGTRPLRRTVPYKAYMGPSVGDLYFRSLEQLDRDVGGLSRSGGQFPLRRSAAVGAARGGGHARGSPARRPVR